jgi:FMN-dependent NADH-azoreductase
MLDSASDFEYLYVHAINATAIIANSFEEVIPVSKTLIVSYLPNAYSVTKKVLDHFIAASEKKTTLVHRDLVKNNPPVYNETSLTAYQMRGFMGKPLTGDHAEAIKPFDVLIDEIKSVNNVVFAFPTHNWSEPGVVKTYIDAILQAGKLIHYTDKGANGELVGHKALVLFASGGVYNEGDPKRTIQNAFTFYLNAIGITDITFAVAGGTLMGDEATAKALASANAVVDGVVANWFDAAQASA